MNNAGFSSHSSDLSPLPEPKDAQTPLPPSTTFVRMRRGVQPTLAPQLSSDLALQPENPPVPPAPEDVDGFVEGEDHATHRKLKEMDVATAAKVRKGPELTREQAVARDVETLRNKLKPESWNKLRIHLDAASNFALAVDYLLSERSWHLYAVSNVDETGRDAGMVLNGSFRKLLGDQIASGSSVPGLLRALCDPQDAEAFLASAWPCLTGGPFGETRHGVVLRRKSAAPAALPVEHGLVKRLAGDVSAKVGGLMKAVGFALRGSDLHKAVGGIDPKVLKQLEVGLNGINRSTVPELERAVDAFLAGQPTQEFLCLSFVRVPGGVAVCGCPLSAEESRAQNAEGKRFQFFPTRAAQGSGPLAEALAELRKLSDKSREIAAKASGSIEEIRAQNPPPADGLLATAQEGRSRAQAVADAADSIAANVLWPAAALAGEQPCPVNIHRKMSDERAVKPLQYEPIFFNAPYERGIGMTFSDALFQERAGADFLSEACVPRAYNDAKNHLVNLRMGRRSDGYEENFTYKTGATLRFRTNIADGALTTEVHEGKLVVGTGSVTKG